MKMLCLLNLELMCFERIAIRFFLISRVSGDSASTGGGATTGAGSSAASSTLTASLSLTFGCLLLNLRLVGGGAGSVGFGADTSVSLVVEVGSFDGGADTCVSLVVTCLGVGTGGADTCVSLVAGGGCFEEVDVEGFGADTSASL